MSKANVFELAQIIKAAKGDPSAVVDAVWEAGYRQPERTAEEAAKITIDTFFYCESFGMPTDFWPRDYDSVLCNELMKAVLTENDDDSLCSTEPAKVAKSILAAGFTMGQSNTRENPASTFQLVPKELTDPMAEAIAYHANCCGGVAADAWEAALAVAPATGESHD
jgi:hypothetical protein